MNEVINCISKSSFDCNVCLKKSRFSVLSMRLDSGPWLFLIQVTVLCFRCLWLMPALPVKTPIRGKVGSSVWLCWLKDVLTTYAPGTWKHPCFFHLSLLSFFILSLKKHFLYGKGYVYWGRSNTRMLFSLFSLFSLSIEGCCHHCCR